MTQQTPLYQLLSLKLGEDAGKAIDDAHKGGESYAAIAARFTYEDDVTITGETLRMWHQEYLEEKA